MERNGKVFPTTRWNLVKNLKNTSSSDEQPIQDLCEQYWEPIYSFIRFRGHVREEAEDLTQAFFAMVIEDKILQRADSSAGRLRSFLLKILSDFLNNYHHYLKAQKRGGGWLRVPFEEPESQLKSQYFVPEMAQEAFDYQWALGIVRQTIQAVREDYESNDSLPTFKCLCGFLPGTINPPTLTEAAAQLDISLSGTRTAVFRLRSRFRLAVRAEIERTLQPSDDIDEELEYLITLLSRHGEKSANQIAPETDAPSK